MFARTQAKGSKCSTGSIRGSGRPRHALKHTAVIALAFSVLATLSPPSGAVAQEEERTVQTDSGAFVDDDGTSHERALNALAARGYLAGTECGERQICPSQPLKRWEMAVWLGRVLSDGEPPAVTQSRFVDVDVNEWWAPDVERFADLGVTRGCSTSPPGYCPDTPVTRAQMATFLVRAFDLPDAPPTGFIDTTGNTHEHNIDALAAARITRGCSTDPLRYCPDSAVTRGQMATFIARAIGLISIPSQQRIRGYSDETGTLAPYRAPVAISGSGRKLLALYMVGSDLEEDGQLATLDLFELIDGYQQSPDRQDLEVVVAFGGANKDGWRGMKLANMAQLLADSRDGRFGNATGSGAYLYQADGAHMGDESSLKLFLDYLRDGYQSFDTRFLTFWDHGGGYGGFGNDTNFGGDPLDLGEIESAFLRSGSQPFDLIGFDACLMATLEVVKVIEPNADYMLASQELEPGHGWLWSDVVASFLTEDDIVEAAKGMVDSFVADVHGVPTLGKTLSLLNLDEYDGLVAALNAATTEFQRHLSQGSSSGTSPAEGIVVSANLAASFGVSQFVGSRSTIDLRDFADLVEVRVDHTGIDASMSLLRSAIESLVVYAQHDGSRPLSSGIAISAPENTVPEYAEYQVSDGWRSFQDLYVSWNESDTTAPSVMSFEAEVEPTALVIDEDQADQFLGTDVAVAVFGDDNLVQVSTIYGFVYPWITSDGELEDYFWPIAHLEAFPTENPGEYFSPAWDQWWFTVEYAPGAPTVPVPAVFDQSYEVGGQTLSTYNAEILYHREDKDYTGYEFPADNAVMTLVVDDYMEVVHYFIQTYQFLYSGPEDSEPTVQFDKNTLKIEPGDGVQFWAWAFHLEDPEEDAWIDYSDWLAFEQEPVFGLEFLEYEDEFGEVLDYYYAMLAEDAAGNEILTELVPASSLGEFSFQVPLSGPSDVATFWFWATAGTTVAFDIEGPGDGSIRLSGPTGEMLFVDETSTGVESAVAQVEVDGLYFLQIESVTLETSSFTVNSNIRMQVFDDPDDDLVLVPGEPYVGYMDFEGDWDWYYLELEEGETVTVTASSQQVDTLLAILYVGGWEVDDDSGGGLYGTDSLLLHTASTTGPIFVGVAEATGVGLGEYTISVIRGS